MKASAEADPELKAFSEVQTLELLLNYIIPRKDTNPIAHKLIEKFGSFSAVFSASRDELKEVPSMTDNAASLVSNFLAIYRKIEISRSAPKRRIVTTADAVKILYPYFIARDEEHVYCLTLDINDNVIHTFDISEGISDSADIKMNKLMSIATRTKAKKIVVAHNHPAGSLEPSRHDVDVTFMLYMMLKSIGVVLSDHLIFTDSGYFSFFDNGLIAQFANPAYRAADEEELITEKEPGGRAMWETKADDK